MAEQIIVNKISETERRIQLRNPLKRNDMRFASRHFTKTEKEVAKNNYKVFKRENPISAAEARDRMIFALASMKHTPKFNFSIILRHQ